MVWALYGLPRPMVAGVNGHAVAGGCILALTADHRVLRRGGAQIGLNEVRVGLPLPWSVSELLRASVPPPALGQVALLGRNFADEEAIRSGSRTSWRTRPASKTTACGGSTSSRRRTPTRWSRPRWPCATTCSRA